MINEMIIKISIVINKDERFIRAILSAVNPENKLSPRGIKINYNVESNKKINYECVVDFSENPLLKIETINRTIDDLIFSIKLAFDALETMIEASTNEI